MAAGAPAAAAEGAVASERLRNVCILAHVDHGKTTCADNLICANGIISRHSAGKIRYMDSRADEQERQITMKSSSIALQWAPPGKPPHMVNLIDSPGHVDFTSEVSTAARLADGAIVVIDVVEGVAAQTRTVLRQAWRDRVKTCLLLNKVDRLITELELSPFEAYQRIAKILEQINAVNQQLLSEEVMAKTEDARPAQGAGDATGDGIDLTGTLEYYDEATEDAWRYAPERGNVAFGSAFHGWAFRVDTFAKLVASKMGAKPEALTKVLWGEWSFNAKTKRANRRAAEDSRTKPMFVQFVLEQLWKAYGAAYKSLDMELLGKMKAQIPAWNNVDLDRLTAGSSAIRELMSRWLPFAEPVLQMVMEHLPSPPAAAPDRLPVLCPRWFAGNGAQAALAIANGGEAAEIAGGLQRNAADAPTVAYLAKFLAADLSRSVLTGDALVGDQEVEFVGICRVFCGTLRPGQALFVTSAADGDEAPASRRRVLVAEKIFILRGRFIEEVQQAPAGYIVAAKLATQASNDVVNDGNDRARAAELGIERCLTLCSSPSGPCFETPYSSQAHAILRVNIEPQRVQDADALYRGLRLLHRADPSVTVDALPSGENVLGCCGDEHLKRCITDLQNLFARGINLSISPPLVAIRESFALSLDAARSTGAGSAMWLPSWASHLADASTEASSHLSGELHAEDTSDAGGDRAAQPADRVSMSAAGIAAVWTANRKACLRVSAVALPAEALEWMDGVVEELDATVHRGRVSPAFVPSGDVEGGGDASLTGCLREASRQLEQRLSEAEFDIAGACGGAAARATPTLCGVSVARGSRTLLFDATGSGWSLWESVSQASAAAGAEVGGSSGQLGENGEIPRWMRHSVLAGFNLASGSGPLSEEPMRGVAFVLQSCQIPRIATGAGVALVPAAPEEDGRTAGDGGYPSGDASSVEAKTVPTAAALAATSEPYGPMSGQLIAAMKEACRCCLFRRGFARISEAMLALEVQSEQEMLGKVYAVLGKRRVKVLEEGLREGTSLFYISSHLPLADSFGLAHDLRQAASGHVSFHCAFSHWELSEEDPFQEASLTAEELEELGDQPLPPNTARKLIDAIRKRKGLATDEKVVLAATKQRTVTRNK